MSSFIPISKKAKRAIYSSLSVVTMTWLFLLFQNAAPVPKILRCSDKKMAEILAPATANAWSSTIDCHVFLKADQVVKKTLVITGGIKGVKVICEHNKDSGKRTRLSKQSGIQDSLAVLLAPALNPTEIAALHKKKGIKAGKYLYSTPKELDSLIDTEMDNYGFTDAIVVKAKKEKLSLAILNKRIVLHQQIDLKLTVLKAHKNAIARNDYSLYPKVLAVMTLETKYKKQNKKRSDWLLDKSRENDYLTPKVVARVEKYMEMSGQRILIISSYNSKNGVWSRPDTASVANCQVDGGIRVMGMTPNGEDKWSTDKLFTISSRTKGHIKRAQKASPVNIVLSNLYVQGKVYFAPGVTKSILKDSTVMNGSVYLDAESASNQIWNNRFVSTAPDATNLREFISVDGSSNNKIAWNIFGSSEYPLNRPGVYIYRNCGENGVSRQQVPHGNEIYNNEFVYAKKSKIKDAAVYVNARYDIDQYYCSYDDKNKYGSGTTNNKETIQGTLVVRNKTFNRSSASEPLQYTHLKKSRKLEAMKEY